jgi:hypothetical protein
MLQRLLSPLLTAASSNHQQYQHVLLPLLQQFQSQHASVLPQQQQQPVACSTPSSSSSFSSLASTSSSSWTASLTSSSAWSHHHQQQLAHYSTRNQTKLNPKERKAQQKTDKKALKKSAVPQGTASAGDSATSFEDDMQAVEADVTRLVLQVGRLTARAASQEGWLADRRGALVEEGPCAGSSGLLQVAPLQ